MTELERVLRELEIEEDVMVEEDESLAPAEEYVFDMVEALMEKGMGEEEAWDHIFDVSAKLEDSGDLPEFPTDPSSAEAETWMRSAIKAKLRNKVLA